MYLRLILVGVALGASVSCSVPTLDRASTDPSWATDTVKTSQPAPWDQKRELVLELKLPRLEGSTARNRKAVDTWVKGIIEQETAELRDWHYSSAEGRDCYPGPDNLSMEWTGSISANAYASVAIVAGSSEGCGSGPGSQTSYTATWNLGTGERIPLSALTKQGASGNSLSSLERDNLIAQHADCLTWEPTDPDQYEVAQPILDRWSIDSDGLVFHLNKYEGTVGYCGGLAVHVHWDALALTPLGQTIAAANGHDVGQSNGWFR